MRLFTGDKLIVRTDKPTFPIDTERKLNVLCIFYSRNVSILILVYIDIDNWDVKGGLSGLRQFLATESPLKRMKNAF